MTVKELMARLAELDENMVVRVADSYWQGEGYGEHAQDLDWLMPTVDVVVEHDGYVSILFDGAYDVHQGE